MLNVALTEEEITAIEVWRKVHVVYRFYPIDTTCIPHILTIVLREFKIRPKTPRMNIILTAVAGMQDSGLRGPQNAIRREALAGAVTLLIERREKELLGLTTVEGGIEGRDLPWWHY